MSENYVPKKNPLIEGRRPQLESECLSLVTRLADLTGADPIEVIAKAAGYKGALRQKVNPASMSDDRLINTVLDLRADVLNEESRAAKRTQ